MAGRRTPAVGARLPRHSGRRACRRRSAPSRAANHLLALPKAGDRGYAGGVPDDVGGKPFPDGDEPDSQSHSGHGAADEEFATVVFDEDFVRSAEVHEATAVERMLAAAQARAEAEAALGGPGGRGGDDERYDDGSSDETSYGHGGYGSRPWAGSFDHDPDLVDEFGPWGPYGAGDRPYRSPARWHRPVAWVLAVLMGVGVVALAFSAVYRGASSSHGEPVPPTSTTGVAPSANGQDAPPASVPAGSAPTGVPPPAGRS